VQCPVLTTYSGVSFCRIGAKSPTRCPLLDLANQISLQMRTEDTVQHSSLSLVEVLEEKYDTNGVEKNEIVLTG